MKQARIHGLSFDDILSTDAISPDGGDLKIDSMPLEDEDFAEVDCSGREARKYNFDVHSANRADILRFIEECENAPDGAEFYPFDELCTYIAYARAASTRPRRGALGTNSRRYTAEANIVARDSHFYEPAQGIKYTRNVSLPQSISIVNEGTIRGRPDYIFLSGKHVGSYQTRDIDLICNGRTTRLVNGLMAGDRFKLDRLGNVRHEFETEFEMTYASLQQALDGSAYCDYGSGGTCAYQSFFMNYSSKILMQFPGPLPVSEDGEPVVRFTLESKAGAPKVWYALTEGLSDLMVVDYDVVVGKNEATIPDVQGRGYLAFGLICDASSQAVVSSLYGAVDRYFDEDLFEEVDPSETVEVEVRDGPWSSHELEAIMIIYRNGHSF